MKQHAYITIGGESLCSYTGCVGGLKTRDKAQARDPQANIVCGHGSTTAAQRAARALRPEFKRGKVKVVQGMCPDLMALAAKPD